MSQFPESLESETKLFSNGVVERVDGQQAWISTEDTSSCSGCQSKGGCGTGTLSKLFSPSASRLIQIEHELSLQVGDKVLLSIDKSHLLKHSMMAYGLPLMMLLLGAWLGLWLFQSDLVSSILGLMSLGLGWLFTKYTYQPVLPKLEKIL